MTNLERDLLADAFLVACVREDIRYHRELGADLNPYSTPGMRSSWDRGFAGVPKALLDYEGPRHRGILARLLTTSQEP